MTTCDRNDALLDLPRSERERPHGPWADHLATCSSCQATASRLRAAETRLNEAFDTRPVLDVDAVLRRAASMDVPTRPRMRRRSLVTGLLAAAAVAALTFVQLRAPDPTLPDPFPTRGDAPTSPAIAADGNVAVLATANPDITVVWFFSGD